MAWTTQELIDQFRLTIPAMSEDVVSDEELASDIEVYRDYVSEKCFGKLFPKALSYFIAHMRTMNGLIASTVSSGSGAADISIIGSVSLEKEGDLERSYTVPNSGSSSSDYAAFLRKSLYGQMFLQLQSMVAFPATIRIGGGRCDWRGR